MTKRFLPFFLLLSICLLPFTGCQGDSPGTQTDAPATEQTDLSTSGTANPAESSATDTAPEDVAGVDPADLPVTGTLQTSKLEILPWDSGRANETSGGDFWEVENGYYFCWRRILYYADKSNLGLWVPVCAQPDCPHDSEDLKRGECDAFVPWEPLLKGDKFYFTGAYDDVEELSHHQLYSTYIGSMALDGSDKRLEYYIPEVEEIVKKAGGSTRRPYLLTDAFLYSVGTLNQDGHYSLALYLVDEAGTEVLFETIREDNNIGGAPSRVDDLYGDEGVFTNIFEPNPNMLYRLNDRQLYGVDLTDLPWRGGHVSGDTLLVFREGLGYYQIDLNTRAEIKLADAQTENSVSHIMAPNCILESTVFGRHMLYNDFLEFRQTHPVEEHTLRLFDGEQWLDVALPEEIRYASDSEALTPHAVTSDRIFLMFRDCADRTFVEPIQLYQIVLGTDTPTLEYVTTIG